MTNMLLAGGGSTGMLVIMVVLMVGLVLMSIIPQRKRQKQAQQMMSSLKVGDTVKTIGGFIGVIKAVDAQNNTLVINISNVEENEVIVTLDRSAVYTVLNRTETMTIEEANNHPAPVAEDNNVVAADDAELDRLASEKKAKKAERKASRAALDKSSQTKSEVEESVNAAELEFAGEENATAADADSTDTKNDVFN